MEDTRGRCLCGSVQWEILGRIPEATICNCTACRRYAALWAHGYEGHEFRVVDPEQMLTAYARGSEPSLSFDFCRRCGNLVSWRGLKSTKHGRTRMAVNLRLAEPDEVAQIPLRRFEGYHSFQDLPLDGRVIRDVSFF